MCDPDFVFLREIDFAAMAARLRGDAVNIEQIDYMTVGDHNRPILEAGPPEDLDNHPGIG